MCSVSAIGDYTQRGWENDWTRKYPTLPDPFQPNFPNELPSLPAMAGPTRHEFDALLAEVLRIKELLEAAVKFDEANSELP